MLLDSPASSWQLLSLLTLALVLSTAIGLERQLHQKSAGMRTHTLVGLGAALFMVISKYGFSEVTAEGLVNLDPSRVAGQVVSGMGFIGAGLIFVRQNRVRGLTTAGSIWLTASVGMAAGAGLVIPAVFVTLCHFLVAYGYPVLARLTHLDSSRQHLLLITYADGVGALRDIVTLCTSRGLVIESVATEVRSSNPDNVLNRVLSSGPGHPPEGLEVRSINLELEVVGVLQGDSLLQALLRIDAVSSVRVGDESE